MKLDKYQLTKDAIKNGEYAEFDVVEKPRRERRPMYLSEVVDQVVEATFSDLRDAYLANDNLTSDNQKLKETIAQYQTQIQHIKSDATLTQEDVGRLQKAESLLENMEKSFAVYKANRDRDAQQIQDLNTQLTQAPKTDEIDRLQSRINELQQADAERETKYNELAKDVNDVLDALESKFSDLPTA